MFVPVSTVKHIQIQICILQQYSQDTHTHIRLLYINCFSKNCMYFFEKNRLYKIECILEVGMQYIWIESVAIQQWKCKERSHNKYGLRRKKPYCRLKTFFAPSDVCTICISYIFSIQYVESALLQIWSKTFLLDYYLNLSWHHITKKEVHKVLYDIQKSGDWSHTD